GAMPDVAPPDEVVVAGWSPMFERRFAISRGQVEGRTTAWLRMRDPIGADPVLQACPLAHLSDDPPTDAVVALHPDRPPPDAPDRRDYRLMSARPDHAVSLPRA